MIPALARRGDGGRTQEGRRYPGCLAGGARSGSPPRRYGGGARRARSERRLPEIDLSRGDGRRVSRWAHRARVATRLVRVWGLLEAMARASARSTTFLNAASRAVRFSGLNCVSRATVFDAKSDAARSMAAVDVGRYRVFGIPHLLIADRSCQAGVRHRNFRFLRSSGTSRPRAAILRST